MQKLEVCLNMLQNFEFFKTKWKSLNHASIFIFYFDKS